MDKSQLHVTGTMGVHSIHESVVYKRVHEEGFHFLTIKYVGETTGLWLALPYVGLYYTGTDYSVDSPVIKNFALVDPNQKTISGTMQDRSIHETVQYTMTQIPLPHFLTINYVEETTGVWLHIPYIGLYFEDTEYSVESPVIDNYELVNPDQEWVEGVMGSESITVDVVYTLESLPLPHFLTIKYVDVDSGWWLSLPYVGVYWEGSDYAVESPEIEGYTLVDPDQETVSGRMGNHSIHEEVAYESIEAIKH